LRGKLWTKSVTKRVAAEMRNRWPMFAERPSGALLQVTVKAESPPDDSFDPKEPDLEDVYFNVVPEARAAA
jgi:hypothetical protein